MNNLKLPDLKNSRSTIAQTLLASCLIAFSQLTVAAKPPTKPNPAPPPGEGRRETASAKTTVKRDSSPSNDSKRRSYEIGQEKV